MNRRHFLGLVGSYSATMTLSRPDSMAPVPARDTTILYDDRAIVVSGARHETSSDGSSEALWIQKRDLPRVNGFEFKPQGACRADICIPIAKGMQRGSLFNLTAFANKIGEKVVADPSAGVWSFGEIQPLRGAFLSTRQAPDITVPDRRGRPVNLSDFRGKKVLLVTWASW